MEGSEGNFVTIILTCLLDPAQVSFVSPARESEEDASSGSSALRMLGLMSEGSQSLMDDASVPTPTSSSSEASLSGFEALDVAAEVERFE